jgi:outer membrane protein assembly factor BamB
VRRLLIVAGLLVLAALIAAGLYEARHPFGGGVLGSATVEYNPRQSAPPPSASSPMPSPMFGGVPQRLHVGAGSLRPPFHLDWVAGGKALIEFPPAVAFGRLYFSNADGDLIALSTRTGARAWIHRLRRCQASAPAVNGAFRGAVYEAFLNRKPCGTDASDGAVVAVAAGINRVHWQRNFGATETSPLIVGGRVYVGSWTGNVYSVNVITGQPDWTFHAGGAVKDAIAYDGGHLFFGAYDGNLYCLDASTGKLVWRSPSDRSFLLGRHGNFYSSPAVAYSRVYIGSTDHNVYSYGERTGKVRWVFQTGGFVYGSPAVWQHRVFVGSYDGTFYALDAATGRKLWSFHANGSISGSATVVDGIVYFATLHKRTYGLDARTGKLVWSFHDGAFTPVVTDGKRLFVVGWSKLYAFSSAAAKRSR